MDKTNIDSPTNPESIFTKAFWIFLAPTLGAIIYSTTYLIGVTYHQTWAGHFNIGPGLFEKSTADYFTYAYIALLQICSNWTNVITDLKIVSFLLITTTLLVVYIFILSWLSRPNKSNTTKPKNKSLALAISIPAISAGITTIILAIPLAANIFLIAPAYTGYKAAQISIERNALKFRTGCEHVKKRSEYCVRLMDGESEIARGFLIDFSSGRIALYLGERASVYPLKDYRIETLLPSATNTDAQD